MLLGDKASIIGKVAKILRLIRFLEDCYCYHSQSGSIDTAREYRSFCSDGINDAPVITLADVGMAMRLGSDAALKRQM